MKQYDETRIADLIVSVLPAGIARACSPDRNSVRFSVRAVGMRLQTIIFKRSSLRRLAADPQRDIKIEYLQRDLLASAERRAEFRYPRLSAVSRLLPVRVGLPMVSMV